MIRTLTHAGLKRQKTETIQERCSIIKKYQKSDRYDKKLLPVRFQEYIETQELFHNQYFRTINKYGCMHAYYFSTPGSVFIR